MSKREKKLRCMDCGDVGLHREYPTLKGSHVLCQKCALKRFKDMCPAYQPKTL